MAITSALIVGTAAAPANASPAVAGYPVVTYMQYLETFTNPEKALFAADIAGASRVSWTATGFRPVWMHKSRPEFTVAPPRGESEWAASSGQPGVDHYFHGRRVLIELRAYSSGGQETRMQFVGRCNAVRCVAHFTGPYHAG